MSKTARSISTTAKPRMSADVAEPRPHCGVLGSPIAHSLSPTLHRAAYAALGLDWEYTAHDVTVAQLPEFMAALEPHWRGLSLTMPLKREVIGWCDRVESLGAMLESINTVVIEDDGARVGYNTDVVGLVRAFKAAGSWELSSAVVIGAGATAASALAALGQLGVDHVTIVARTPERAEPLRALAPALGLTIEVVPLDAADRVPPADAVVSTIPADSQEAVAETVASWAPVVLDVIYHPAKTPLLRAAHDAGCTTIPGFELLLHQAARQVELMTGKRPAPVDVMRVAGMAVLGNR
jgi:shikimate dehydrogenase